MPARSPDAVPTQKQRFNVYTMMLILSFVAITTACVMLYSELYSYTHDADGKPTGKMAWDASDAKFIPPAATAPTP